MAIANLIPERQAILADTGLPLAGGLVYAYAPGTTSPIITYADSGLTVQNPHPVVLNGAGRAQVWASQDCDLDIRDQNNVQVLFEQNVNPDELDTSESGGLVPNGSFETDADSNDVPDGWTETADVGSNNGLDTSQSTDGAQSFRFTSAGTGGGQLESTNFFPVNDAENLRVNVDLRSTIATVRNIIRVRWFDSSQVFISNSDAYDSTANPLTFTSQQLSVAPPTGARFAKLVLIGCDSSVAVAGSTYFDRVQVFYPAVVSGTFDNLLLSGNTISSTNTNGDINLTPNGTGSTVATNLAALNGASLGVSGVESVQVHADGITITEAGLAPFLAFQATSGASRQGFLQSSAARIELRQESHGGDIRLSAEDVGGTLRTLIDGDPDDSVDLHYAGILRALTRSNGLEIRSSANDNVTPNILVWSQLGGTVQGLAGVQGDSFIEIENQIHGAGIRLSAEDAGGSPQTLVTGDPDGAASMAYAGTLRLTTNSAGVAIIRSDGNTDTEGRQLQLTHQDGTDRALFGFDGDGQLRIRNLIHGNPVLVQAEDAGGTVQQLLNADPDGAASLYYAGAQKVETITDGVIIRGNGSPGVGAATQDSEVRLTQQDGTIIGRLGFLTSSALFLRSLNHGGEISIQAEDAGGTNRSLVTADPDGAALTYHAGTVRTATVASGGLAVRSDGSTDTENRQLQLTHQDGTIRGIVGYSASDTLLIESRIHGASVTLRGEDAGGTVRNIVSGDPDGRTRLYDVGVEIARTATAANGGFEANNTLTGGGFERVLTSSDSMGFELAANDTIASDTTVGTTGIELFLEPGTYSFEALMRFFATTTAGMGVQYRLNFSGTLTRSSRLPVIQRLNNSSTAGAAMSVVNTTVSSGTISTLSANPDYFYDVGTLTVSTSGVLSIQAAQNTSNANNLNIQAGSYLKVTALAG